MADDLKNLDETTGSAAWDKFRDSMRRIVNVPRSEIKKKLDAEDATRRRKRTRSAKVRAFREANKQTVNS